MASSDSKDTEKAIEGEDLLHESERSKDSEKASTGCCSCTKKKRMILAIVLVMILLYALGIGIGLAIGLSKKDSTEGTKELRIPMGAVVSDHVVCSDIGRDMLRRHGTMVDAALATLICLGVRVPHSMGIGGGSFIVIYDKGAYKALTIDGRETAPLAMTPELYRQLKDNNGCSMVIYDKGAHKVVLIDGMTVAPFSMTLQKYTDMTNNNIQARKIGVPGELKAYKMAHDLYGFLPWSELFKPTIKMVKEGFPISESTSKALATLKRLGRDVRHYPALCSVFCASTATGEGKKPGEIIYWPKMATTLEGIARDGPDYIYDSDLSQVLVDEIQADGGVMKFRDLKKNYKLKMDPAYSVDLGDYTLYTMPGATGGPVVAMITNIIQEFNLTNSSMTSMASKAEIYHKIVEAMKFSYADRAKLGDPAFENVSQILDRMQSEEYARLVQSKITSMTHEESYYTDMATSYEDAMGTSHVSVISPYGDAVSITSSINHYFGSMIMSNSTGILWNNEMDDFSTKETDTVNFIEPGKRPRSSMAPVIVVDNKGDVKVVIGAAGGVKIANSIAQVLIKLLWLDQPVDKAIEEKRFHHMLAGNTLITEQGFPEALKKELENKGHQVKSDIWPYMGVVDAILVDNDGVMRGHADSRKQPGKASYMYDYRTYR